MPPQEPEGTTIGQFSGNRSSWALAISKASFGCPDVKAGCAAAALRHREMHADALLLDQRNRIHTRFGHENVQQACAEKIHIGRFAADSGFGICVHGLAFGLCFGKLVRPILLE